MFCIYLLTVARHLSSGAGRSIRYVVLVVRIREHSLVDILVVRVRRKVPHRTHGPRVLVDESRILGRPLGSGKTGPRMVVLLPPLQFPARGPRRAQISCAGSAAARAGGRAGRRSTRSPLSRRAFPIEGGLCVVVARGCRRRRRLPPGSPSYGAHPRRSSSDNQGRVGIMRVTWLNDTPSR